jgi:putative GTP pyrophosphokinase
VQRDAAARLLGTCRALCRSQDGVPLPLYFEGQTACERKTKDVIGGKMENQAAKTEPVSETAGKTDPSAAGQDQQRPVEEINPFDYPGTERVRIRHLETKQMSQEDIDRVLQLTGQHEAFEILMMYYDCALVEVRTKLEVLNREVGLKKNRNPFESIKSRLKKPVSIYEKLKHRRIPFSVENIEKYLTDVAGLRVICSFIDDIYSIRDSLASQDDVRIIQEKDYIAHPKPNGYRSLHLILEVPIYLMQEKKYMRVELQFRTIAMDFWASVEHKMKYKREIRNAESIVEELRYSADLINQLDRRMLQIRDRIELNEEGDRVMSEWH